MALPAKLKKQLLVALDPAVMVPPFQAGSTVTVSDSNVLGDAPGF